MTALDAFKCKGNDKTLNIKKYWENSASRLSYFINQIKSGFNSLTVNSWYYTKYSTDGRDKV